MTEGSLSRSACVIATRRGATHARPRDSGTQRQAAGAHIGNDERRSLDHGQPHDHRPAAGS
ncbi:hypothetical protein WI23_24940 [Burkholderia oklahomensis C6786]|nr:hypothetical protein WI23_24940 [Burkholderia oklahomensis C6786]KUY60904.1 hypothetical protein WI23_14555 [Burkholderia oklahomensis C6786]